MIRFNSDTLPPAQVSAYGNGNVSIWWYLENGEFLDFSLPVDEAEKSGYTDENGIVWAHNSENHLSLWRRLVKASSLSDDTKKDF